MSETGNSNQNEKAAKIRRKPERESALSPTFAVARQTTPDRHQAQPSGGGLLQRQCSCGKHTIGGGVCEECQQKQGAASSNPLDELNLATPPDIQTIRDTTAHFNLSHIPAQTRLTANGQLLQLALTVNAPGDQYEQEADRVAEAVMRMPDLTPPSPSAEINSFLHPTVSRLPAISRIQTSGGSGAFQTPAHVETHINQMQGSGQPLPDIERDFFESRMGYDFSQVRVHTDSNAVQASQDIQAKAFTVGNNIVFNAGKYQPGTDAGRRLLGHELAHVVQQGSAFREPLHIQTLRIIQRQTDASVEAGTGVGRGITNGTMVPDNSIMGNTYVAENCRGLYGCNINFDFGKAYKGVYPYAAAGKDIKGVYVKISAYFDATICGNCSTVRLIQILRNTRKGRRGNLETADPGNPTRRERSGWGDRNAPSRGWRVDTLVRSTNPFYTSSWVGTPGNSNTPAVLWDTPGNWADTTNTGKDFQTCAVCDEGGQRKVLACVTWGYYTDASGNINFQPATPVATCGPSQELEDAATRWDSIRGNQKTNIDFAAEEPVEHTDTRSLLWFDLDSTSLRQDDEIDSMIHWGIAMRRIRQHLLAVGEKARIVVHGYSSSDGQSAYNHKLSQRRADAIMARLIAEGIPADWISAKPHGEDETYPTADYNRRVEIEHVGRAVDGAIP